MPQEKYIIINSTANFNESNDDINDPIILSKRLHQLTLKLKGQNLMNEKEIDYKSLIQNDLFKNEYCFLAGQLKNVDLNKLIDEENKDNTDINLLSFFINVYNSLTIHSIAFLYINDPKLQEKEEINILDQVNGKFWSRMAYKIDKFLFSLDDIEHGIIRANRPHPTTKLRSFDQNDERMKFVINKFDCRIHFALNCGARGCPPISFYTPTNLKDGLEMAASSFTTSEFEIDINKCEFTLSRIFLWYKMDFICEDEQNIAVFESISSRKQEELLLKYIFSHMRQDDEKCIQLKHIFASDDLKKFKFSYASYNWIINVKNL